MVEEIKSRLPEFIKQYRENPSKSLWNVGDGVFCFVGMQSDVFFLMYYKNGTIGNFYLSEGLSWDGNPSGASILGDKESLVSLLSVELEEW